MITPPAFSTTGIADGLNLFGGYSAQEQATAHAGGDRTGKVIGATYAVGSVTLGYQWSMDNQKAVNAASTSYYENDAYGITFAVNDDLSLSYGVHKSNKVMGKVSTSTKLNGDSIQVAYSMGGASIKLAETSVKNGKYNTATDRDATTLALTLAF